MALLSPHWEALTPATRQAFQVAGTLPFIHRYYLAGGTGLALQLGHRFSVDLDFFSPAPDAEATPMPQMIERVAWTTVRRFLERQALEAGRKRLDELWPA